MTTLLGRVRNMIDTDCLVKGRLNKDGCKVVMTNAPAPRLIVDFDKPGSPLAEDVARCDYLLVAEDEHTHSWVAVLELKRGKLHAEQVVRQLQAGASAAEKFVSQEQKIAFRPIAASGSTAKHERAKLRQKANAITFHGNKELVRLMSCGARLAQALRS